MNDRFIIIIIETENIYMIRLPQIVRSIHDNPSIITMLVDEKIRESRNVSATCNNVSSNNSQSNDLFHILTIINTLLEIRNFPFKVVHFL